MGNDSSFQRAVTVAVEMLRYYDRGDFTLGDQCHRTLRDLGVNTKSATAAARMRLAEDVVERDSNG